MRTLFIILFAVVSLLAFLLPFTVDFKSTPAPSASISGLPPVPQLPAYDEMPDFSDYTDVQQKKADFFAFLLPLIEAENLRILHQREKVLQIEQAFHENVINDAERQQLNQLMEIYEIDPEMEPKQIFETLKRRVDSVPEMMVLVQAANESAWGASRFAQQGLNLFGQWCYREGCGIIPGARPEGQRYEVAKFDSVNKSVRSYMRNINTHAPYLELRMLREQKRQRDEQVKAMELVEGLGSYSERGDEYIEELQAMIRVNRPIVEAVKAEAEEQNTAQ